MTLPGFPLETFRSPFARKLGAAFLALIVLFLWWNMVRRALAGPSSQINDFIRFSRHLIFEGRNVYEEYPASYTITKYPPFFAFLFAPLVPLPMAVAASIWFWLNLGLAAAASVVSARVVEGRPGAWRERRSLAVAPFVFAAPVIISNLETGQVNIVIVFVVILALLAFRRRRELAAGALLGGVTALKLTPGLFVLYFAWKGAWRVVLGAVAGLVVCWVLVPLPVLGPDRYAGVMQEWLRDVAPFVEEGTRAEGIGGFRHTNQSLAAAVHRTITRTPAGAGREDLYLNVVSLERETAHRIVQGIGLAILLALAWLCRTPIGDRSRLELSFEYALVMIAMLFLSPISWINHYVILIFPFAAALAYVATRGEGLTVAEPAEGEAARRRLELAVWISFALLLTSVSRFLQALSLPFLGAVVLVVAMGWTLAEQAGFCDMEEGRERG